MTKKGKRQLKKVEGTLADIERQLMDSNRRLGDILYSRYKDRMGFNKDGSFSRDGRVVWPERMVE
jgi:hypothetical protein